MRNITIYLVAFVCSLFTKIMAQENTTFEQKVNEISSEMENITSSEKEELRKKVEEINALWDKNEITKQQADERKLEAAKVSALTIEKKLNKQQQLLNQLVKDKVDGKLFTESNIKKNKFSIDIKTKKDTIQKSEKRTTSQFVFAIGLNHVTTNERIARSDFGYLRSRFYEWGMTYNTRLAKENNLAHLKYGFSVQYNNLQPTQNRVFQTFGNQTILVNSPITLRHSRLRNVNLVFPVHFELDFTKTKTINDSKVYRSHNGFRLGVGGYAGVNLKTKQVLRYNDIFGNKNREISKGDFNVNNFVYGLSSYIGYRETSLYVKYDLNNVFTNNPTDQKNVSLGVRFDFN